MCSKTGIPLNAFFIIGFPGETLSQIHDTLDFALMLNKRYGVYPFVNFAIPLKGTPLYQICEKNGFLTEEITSKSLTECASFRGTGKISTPEFTPEQLSLLMKTFNHAIFRNSFYQALKDPRIAMRYAQYAWRNFSHFRRYAFG